MKFGSLEHNELDAIDWKLPEDHSGNSRFHQLSHTKKTKIKIGCAKWQVKGWVGTFYPEKTKNADHLKEYIKLFDSIELNNTFYRLSRTSIEKWVQEVQGQSFTFCPKWSRRVSHLKRLNDVDENIEYFIESCRMLGDHLDGTLLQMPENFGAKNFDRIKNFANKVPNDFPVFVELRHKEWFVEPVFSELCDLLEEYKFGLVMTDVAARRDTVHMRLTCPETLIRFNGYDHPSDLPRINAWAKKLKEWEKIGLSKVHFYFHNANENLNPNHANALISLLNT